MINKQKLLFASLFLTSALHAELIEGKSNDVTKTMMAKESADVVMLPPPTKPAAKPTTQEIPAGKDNNKSVVSSTFEIKGIKLGMTPSEAWAVIKAKGILKDFGVKDEVVLCDETEIYFRENEVIIDNLLNKGITWTGSTKEVLENANSIFMPVGKVVEREVGYDNIHPLVFDEKTRTIKDIRSKMIAALKATKLKTFSKGQDLFIFKNGKLTEVNLYNETVIDAFFKSKQLDGQTLLSKIVAAYKLPEEGMNVSTKTETNPLGGITNKRIYTYLDEVRHVKATIVLFKATGTGFAGETITSEGKDSVKFELLEGAGEF